MAQISAKLNVEKWTLELERVLMGHGYAEYFNGYFGQARERGEEVNLILNQILTKDSSSNNCVVLSGWVQKKTYNEKKKL